MQKKKSTLISVNIDNVLEIMLHCDLSHDAKYFEFVNYTHENLNLKTKA